MSVPLYFLPGVQISGLLPGGAFSRSLLGARGLGRTWEDVEPGDLAHCSIATKGPDGGPGLLIAALPVLSREPPRRLGYYPDDDSIAWSRVGEGLWMGIDRQLPPTPADLRRRSTFAGYETKLGDGQRWVVPVVRDYAAAGPALPCDLFWTPEGKFVRELRPEYREVWERTERVWRFLEGDEPRSPNWEEEYADLILAALALNYRLGRPELAALRLLNSSVLVEAVSALVDGPKVHAYFEAVERAAQQKKSAGPVSPLSSTPISPGAADCSPGTDPAAAISGSSPSNEEPAR